MSEADPIRELAHDHSDLNRRVLEIGDLIQRDIADLRQPLNELREHLFLHFAREEEGLFPFVGDHMPDLVEHVTEMATAHDAICGAVARMCHMATSEARTVTLRAVFERFQLAYAAHAKFEADLLRSLESRLDAEQRTQLASLVRGL